MKKTSIILIVLALIFQSQLSFAAVSHSQSFKVSVTIPAVVGINVKAPVQNTLETKKIQDFQTQKQEVVRNNESIVLETTVLK